MPPTVTPVPAVDIFAGDAGLLLRGRAGERDGRGDVLLIARAARPGVKLSRAAAQSPHTRRAVH